MNAKHTPGPWEIRPSPYYEYDIISNHATVGKNALVARIRSTGYADNPDIHANMREANAKLIVSAPDLLAERDRLRAENTELRAYLQLWLNLYAEPLSGIEFNDMLVNTEKITRAALAKAREGKL